MKRWQQLLSFYLALCVVFAGAVGISPALHVFVEHGGQGAAHTHLGTDGVAYSHVDVGAQEPGVFRSFVPLAASPRQAKLLVAGTEPVTLFGLRPQDITRALGQLLAKAIDRLPAAPSNREAGHTHHSLAQMLVGGVIEGAAAVPLLVLPPVQLLFISLLPATRPAPALWYAPTASRGPPFC